MEIDNPLLALAVYFGVGIIGNRIGISTLASAFILIICAAYFLRGVQNLISKASEHKVNWGIFEVDKGSLFILVAFFIYALTQVSSIESISNWIVVILGMIFTYKAISHYFIKK